MRLIVYKEYKDVNTFLEKIFTNGKKYGKIKL